MDAVGVGKSEGISDIHLEGVSVRRCNIALPVVCVRTHAQSLSRIQLFTTLWMVAPQAPQFMGFFRQEYWSGLPFPPPGDLPTQGSNPRLPVSCFARWILTTWRKMCHRDPMLGLL